MRHGPAQSRHDPRIPRDPSGRGRISRRRTGEGVFSSPAGDAPVVYRGARLKRLPMRAFIHDQPTLRVVFGDGRLADLPAEADRLGLKRLLVLSTPEQEEA